MQPDRYAVELVISGLLRALVRSKAVNVNILEDHVLVPLLHHMHVHESYRMRQLMSRIGGGTTKFPSNA